jgi:hypothetical protein
MEKVLRAEYNFTSDEVFNIIVEHLKRLGEFPSGNENLIYSFHEEFSLNDNEMFFSIYAEEDRKYT